MPFRALPLILLLAAIHVSAAETATAPGAAKPNLVIILIDDMGYGDVGCFGSQLNRTPSIDRMAREGMRLTSFYACPVCTPSRAQLLTGCYAKRVSLPNVIGPDSRIGLSGKEHTIAALLKQQGYATMCVGKWHVGDQIEFLPTRRGFDHYFGLPYSNDMFGEWDGVADVPPKERRPPLPLIRDEEIAEIVTPARQDDLTRLYTDEAVGFIRGHRDAPFFLYFAHTAVHGPLHPGPDFKGKSKNGEYGDWVEEMDASTGRVLDTLRELGLEKNTLVVFSSDNGHANAAASAGPLRGHKGSTYEGGMREPTVAWWPGRIAEGAASDAIAGVIDLLPTYVALAGGAVPTDRKIDGADLGPLLFGKAEAAREVQYCFNGETLEAVRRGTWKLAIAPQREGIHDTSPRPSGAFRPRLYDLAADIGERTDVADRHPEVVSELLKLVEAMDADLGSTRRGKGVRPPGEVKDPKPLLKKSP